MIKQNLLFIATILALCVISFVHVFLFPLYDVNPKRSNFKTFFDFEQSLCLANLKPARRTRHRTASCSPTASVVTAMQGGRLGNQMWEYASVWGIARRTGLDPYVPRCILWTLKGVFETLSITSFEEIGHCLVDVSTFVHNLDAWNYTNQSIVLRKYYIQPDVVLTWVQDIIKEFTFRKKLRTRSQDVLRLAKGNKKTATFVGVHVRRTDYLRYLWSKHKSAPAESKFYLEAMKYYEDKFDDCVFVVVSDDPKWCSDQFASKRNVYLAGQNPPGLDLAILAACNHSIFDYGTFGTWGAILAGGETLYYNLTRHSSRRVGQLLPNWRAMS